MVCRLVNPTIFRLYVSQNSDLNKTKSEIGRLLPENEVTIKQISYIPAASEARIKYS